jgi:hypothetical protein
MRAVSVLSQVKYGAAILWTKMIKSIFLRNIYQIITALSGISFAIALFIMCNIYEEVRTSDAIGPVLLYAGWVAFVFEYSFLFIAASYLMRGYLRSSIAYAFSVIFLFCAPTLKDFVSGDPFCLPQPMHDTIRAAYAENRSNLIREDSERPRAIHHGIMTILPRTVLVDEGKCHPPSGCSCWIIWDPAHISEVEKDVSGWLTPGWLTPKAGLLSASSTQTDFRIAHIRPIDSNAYSAIGCVLDWRALQMLG